MTDFTNPVAEPHRFSLGRVISLTFAIYFRNFVPFFLMAFVVNLPLLFWQLSLDPETAGGMPSFGIAEILGNFMTVILGLVVTGAILFGVYQQMRGEPFAARRAIEVAGGRVLAIVGVSLVSGFIVAIGFMLLIIPGIVFALMFMVAVPATVVERIGPLDALTRSKELTEGHRLELLGFGILYAIAMWLISSVVMLGSGVVLEFGSSWTVIWHAFSVALGLIQSVALGVIYYELRRSKEGLDLNQLAASFE